MILNFVMAFGIATVVIDHSPHLILQLFYDGCVKSKCCHFVPKQNSYELNSRVQLLTIVSVTTLFYKFLRLRNLPVMS